ncbi:metaxin-2-like [Panonychus citri]|uniref:metaxin-2-like n=1 Tax=Panonychus citri TaxID=50023 RepID=UPI00230829E4|nr:metaxin-2-like [Panonychus citri]XP_053204153.1 metaxin-2-like [Panonychus citri]
MDQKEDSELWSLGVTMFTPAGEQILLNERANCIAAEIFLKMCDIHSTTEERANTEYMSPNGDVPFIKCGNELVAGMENIVDFFKSKNISLSSHLDEQKQRDCRVYMNYFQLELTNSELYFTWCHDKVTQEYTYPRCTSVYSWPLNSILYMMKKRNITKKLKLQKITDIEQATKSVEKVFTKLSEILIGPYFFGNKPTELDALIFGHISAILTTALPDDSLAILVRENQPLVNLCNLIGAEYFPSILTTEDQ